MPTKKGSQAGKGAGGAKPGAGRRSMGDQGRTVPKCFRLTGTEIAAWTVAAKAAGMSFTEFVLRPIRETSSPVDMAAAAGPE
ncbi:MAG: hypothetical protein LBU23_00535, partial [Planctomycetota bacterium]|nr:hypothetical protein [Planctomycetota bacterium]